MMCRSGDPRKPAVAAVVDVCLIVVFVTLLLLPLADQLLGLDPTPVMAENRTLASLPDLEPTWSSLTAFPWAFEAWVNDHMGFRRLLVRARSWGLVAGLGVSPNDDVILGRDGWLFYAGQQKLDYFRSVELYFEQELEHFRRSVERNRDRLRALGIEYVLLIAPDKDSIYPELMPRRLEKVHERSRLDQVTTYLGQHSDVTLVDPRPALWQAKQEHRLYDRADTHWNDIGALIGYQELIRSVAHRFPAVGQPARLESFELVRRRTGYFDLLVMLGLQEVMSAEGISLVPRQPLRAGPTAPGTPLETAAMTQLTPVQRPWVRAIDEEALPRVTVFHDSFGERLKPMLAEHFQRTAFFHLFYSDSHYVGYETSSEIVARELPDIVIQEVVERGLQLGAAIRCLVEPEPEMVRTLVRTGRGLSDTGRHTEAVRTLRAATRLGPSDAEAWANLGLAAGRLGDLKQARIALERVLKLEPRHYYGHHLLAQTLLALGHPRRTVTLEAAAAALATTDQQRGQSLAVSAAARWRLGQRSRACAEISTALELSRHPDILQVAGALECPAGARSR